MNKLNCLAFNISIAPKITQMCPLFICLNLAFLKRTLLAEEAVFNDIQPDSKSPKKVSDEKLFKLLNEIQRKRQNGMWRFLNVDITEYYLSIKLSSYQIAVLSGTDRSVI